MSTRDTILAAALQVLEEGGASQFSTRTVCGLAKVTAPTLYHHFGSADGLLSAAMAEGFRQFLLSKRAAIQSSDPATALREGWDDYVRFAAARPRLFAAVMGRLLDGAEIAAAAEGQASLTGLVTALSETGHLTLPADTAADLVWASANAAAMLHITAHNRNAPPPTAETITTIRDAAFSALLA